MKYLNTCYNLFLDNTFNTSKDKNSNAFLTNSTGFCRIPLDLNDNGKLYISFEVERADSYSYDRYFFKCYDDSGNTNFYNFYRNSDATATLEDSDNNTLYRWNVGNSTWHKIYQILDYANGTVDFYLDGELVYKATGLNKTKPTNCVFNAANNFWIKNIILSDEPFDMKETVLEVDTSITAGGWTESSGTYSTDITGNTLTITPTSDTVAGYNVKDIGFAALNAVSSENVGGVDVIIKGTIQSIALRSEAGAVFVNAVEADSLDTSITVTSN